MSEQTQQQTPQQSSPLVTERGSTTIGEGVVSELANRAAGRMEGVYVGGTSGNSGGLLGRGGGASRGMSIQVGRTEVALDLKLGIDYGKNFVQTVEQLRRSISEEIEGTTGLKVTEFNATITEVVFPEESASRAQSSPSESEQTAEPDAGSESETRRVR